MSLLEKINTPSDIKGYTLEELEQLCKDIREYMIECCSSNPGHLGASLGAVELCVALHYVYNTPEDKIVFDVGHQAYAHKIITGRREIFKQNRMYKGISGFPKISESPYDSFGTGHSSTSISSALGLAVAAKAQGKDSKAIAVIGDGAMTGGMAFEALNNAGCMKTDILVILNDNQISIDKNTGALHNHLLNISTSATYNKVKKHVWDTIGANKIRSGVQRFVSSTKNALLKQGSMFESLGFRYFGTIDGNNIHQLVETLQKLHKIDGPKILHIVTTKGKGYEPAETNQVVWHAPGKFNPKTGERTTSSNGGISRFQDVFGQTLLDLAKANPKIVGITPAMASGCGMNIMMKEMPERVFDVGIAEPHAVTFTAGLAAGGMLPVCNIYSSFMQRAYDNIIHDLALQNLKAIICLDRAGIVGEDGATHHGSFDMAALRPIPNIVIGAPINESDLRNMLYSATLPHYPTTILRYPRGLGIGAEWKDQPFTEIPLGKGVLLSDGKDIALLSVGAIGNNCHKAVLEAREKGISTLHYDMRFIKPIDTDILKDVCSKVKTIITVEDGAMTGGLYSAVSEYVATNAPKIKVIGMGIPDRFIEQGTIPQLHADCGYDPQSIYKTIIDNVK